MKLEKHTQRDFRDVFVGYENDEIIDVFKESYGEDNPHQKFKVPKYKNNSIWTSNYNYIDFLPKSILIQFLRVYNFYFLVTTVLQAVPQVTTTPIYIAALPFIFLLLEYQ